jgi:phenylpyruvate tautomerase PptA (4-oxalocrotonate tautomerase family)
MPYLKLQTNQVLSEEEKAALCKIASECIAQSLEKSKNYVMVVIQSDMAMIFADGDEPCAFVELKSIGLPAEKILALSRNICELIQQNIGVPPERTYIEFSDAERSMWGWNGKTF